MCAHQLSQSRGRTVVVANLHTVVVVVFLRDVDEGGGGGGADVTLQPTCLSKMS